MQYVAVQSGYEVDAAFQQELMSQLVGWQRMCRRAASSGSSPSPSESIFVRDRPSAMAAGFSAGWVSL